MAKKGDDKEEASPTWLEEGKVATSDQDDEAAPLFGTGAVSLQDGGDQDNDEPKANSYGAVSEEEEENGLNDKDDKNVKHGKEWHQDKPKKKKKTKRKKKSDVARAPRKNCCLHFFTLVQMLAIVACLGLLATQLLPLFLVPLDQIGVLQLALRAYVSLFCLIFLLVEFDVKVGFIQNSDFFQNFFTRGFIYSFVGLIGMEEAYEVIVTHLTKTGGSEAFDEFHIAWAPLFIKVTSWLMVVVGCIYMVLGLLFMKHLRDGLQRNYERAVERYRQQGDADAL